MSNASSTRRGATMVTVSVMLPVLFAMSAFAINIAYVQVVKSKVQVATDAAARAAGTTYVETGDRAEALAAAQQYAALNPIESVVLTISQADLEYGLSQRPSHNKAYTFASIDENSQGNSVRLTTNAFAAGSGSALKPYFAFAGMGSEIRPTCTATHTQATLDVCVIVDRSGSMAYAANENSGASRPAAAPYGWQFGDPVPPKSRWLDLVAAVDGFCDELTHTAKIEKVALCSYASNSSTPMTLTDDYSLISSELIAISSAFNGGRTNVGDGILEGVAAVSDPKYARPWANNALVLMSDGNHNTGTDPMTGVAEAVSENVSIYTVSFSSEADQDLMKQIANMTGGRHYHAINAEQLNAAFREIARRLPSILTQ